MNNEVPTISETCSKIRIIKYKYLILHLILIVIINFNITFSKILRSQTIVVMTRHFSEHNDEIDENNMATAHGSNLNSQTSKVLKFILYDIVRLFQRWPCRVHDMEILLKATVIKLVSLQTLTSTPTAELCTTTTLLLASGDIKGIRQVGFGRCPICGVVGMGGMSISVEV